MIVAFVRNTKLKRRKEQMQFQMNQARTELDKKIKEQEVAELQYQKTELELQALRAQMNPHFIFNCLNSINRFIIKNDAVKAADYLTKFAKLIRIVLQQSGKPLFRLEMNYIACNYIWIWRRLRFGILLLLKTKLRNINTHQ
jgi:sensor histidine kinase YesM